MSIRNAALTLCLLLPLVAQAGEEASPAGIGEEVSRELGEARREVAADLAEARLELTTGNLRIDNGLQFGHHDNTDADPPVRAEITPQGDLLIEGEAQAIDAGQRRQLLAYRGQVIGIALAGIDIGQRTADAALAEVENSSWIGLLFGAMSGRLERRIEHVVKQELEPAMHDLCRQLPAVMASQQQLATSLPQFRPYATLESGDVDDCENMMQEEFASL
ncbi:hypothetical protein [Novilysobacter arseniciresistens]|uniref:hypothetical protein n=1 Tax=Novilysobacter arseniciresistens TaxID=1385522 RepID=UPI00055ABF4D|nr:hypothetical protein [Lysobacter arseniciresistens]